MKRDTYLQNSVLGYAIGSTGRIETIRNTIVAYTNNEHAEFREVSDVNHSLAEVELKIVLVGTQEKHKVLP